MTAVPFGTTTKLGSKKLPVGAKETQLEPARGPAQNGSGSIFCVGLAVELVVVPAELNRDTESAFATITMPVMKNMTANIANLVFTAASSSCATPPKEGPTFGAIRPASDWLGWAKYGEY